MKRLRTVLVANCMVVVTLFGGVFSKKAEAQVLNDFGLYDNVVGYGGFGYYPGGYGDGLPYYSYGYAPWGYRGTGYAGYGYGYPGGYYSYNWYAY